MSTSPQPGRSKASLDYAVRIRIIDTIDANLRLLIKFGLLAVIALFGYRSISVLAGQHTFADIGVRFLSDIRLGTSLGYALGAGGLYYGRKQKKLREDTIQQLAPRIKELETLRDANRSSSGLTKRGHTRPEDL